MAQEAKGRVDAHREALQAAGDPRLPVHLRQSPADNRRSGLDRVAGAHQGVDDGARDDRVALTGPCQHPVGREHALDAAERAPRADTEQHRPQGRHDRPLAGRRDSEQVVETLRLPPVDQWTTASCEKTQNLTMDGHEF